MSDVNLSVQISANARHSEIVGWVGDRLKIRIKAPAVDGKANAELLRFLSETLDVRQNCVHILRGETAKLKVISIEGVEPSLLHEKIAPKD